MLFLFLSRCFAAAQNIKLADSVTCMMVVYMTKNWYFLRIFLLNILECMLIIYVNDVNYVNYVNNFHTSFASRLFYTLMNYLIAIENLRRFENKFRIIICE